MTELSLIINGLVFGCGIAVGFPMGALWILTKQSDTPAPSKTSEQMEEV